MTEILNIREEEWGIAVQIPSTKFDKVELVYDRSSLEEIYGVGVTLDQIKEYLELIENLEGSNIHKGKATGKKQA